MCGIHSYGYLLDDGTEAFVVGYVNLNSAICVRYLWCTLGTKRQTDCQKKHGTCGHVHGGSGTRGQGEEEGTEGKARGTTPASKAAEHDSWCG